VPLEEEEEEEGEEEEERKQGGFSDITRKNWNISNIQQTRPTYIGCNATVWLNLHSKHLVEINMSLV